MGFPNGSASKEYTYNAGDRSSIPGSGRFPGEGNGNPFQHSWLKNPMDGGTWWATAHLGRQQSDTTEWLRAHLEKLKWKSLSCVQFFGNPMDCSPPGSSLHGISQARILECDTISFSRDLPDSGIEPTSSVFPALGGGFFTTPPGKPPLVLITPALIGDLVNVFYTLLTLVQIFVTYLCLG